MSGSEAVRAYRHRNRQIAAQAQALPQTAPAAQHWPTKVWRPKSWRNTVFAVAALASLAGFGSIVVQASDNAGVFEVAKSYTSQRGVPRFQLPQFFQAARHQAPPRHARVALPQGALGGALGGALALPATGKRALDRSRTRAAMASRSGGTSTLAHNRPGVRKAQDSAEFRSAFLKSRTSYCVRTCDGYFFPVGNADTASPQAHEAACARACPNAQTAVYVAPAGGRGIEDAINRRGQRYQATLTAFNYRTQFDNACSCNTLGAARNYSVLNDFTLRPGDMVMSREGLKVFRGTETFPYRSAHFGRAVTARLSARDRRFVELAEASSLRGIAGARVPVTLQSRIADQLARSRGTSATTLADATLALRGARPLRYVGPDAGTVETR